MYKKQKKSVSKRQKPSKSLPSKPNQKSKKARSGSFKHELTSNLPKGLARNNYISLKERDDNASFEANTNLFEQKLDTVQLATSNKFVFSKADNAVPISEEMQNILDKLSGTINS